MNGVNYQGQGRFKFALVNSNGTVTYWSHDGTSTGGSAPTGEVLLPVTKGLYSVMLGDVSVPNMEEVPASVYQNGDLRLRVWFNDGALGFQQLTPDQRLSPNGYLPDGSIGANKLAPGAEAPAIAVSGSSQDLAPNQRYVATGNGSTTFSLPLAAKAGDKISIDAGAGGLTINDSGDSVWKQAGFGFNQPAVGLFCPGDGSILWAWAVTSGSNYPSLHRGSLNGFSSFSSFPSPQRVLSFASSDDSTKLLVGSYSNTSKGLYRSLNTGSTWERVGPTEDIEWKHVAASSDGGRMYAAADFGQLHVSTDTGATWTAVGAARSWRKICCSADGMKVFAGSTDTPSGSITFSNDGGATWTSMPSSIGAASSIACSDDGNTIAFGVFNAISVSRDGGQTWESNAIEAGYLAMSADGRTIASCQHGSRIRISRDSGRTWGTRENARTWSGIACSRDGRTIIALQSSLPWFYYSGGAMFTSANGGSVDLVYGDGGWRVSRGLDGWTQNGNNVSLNGGNLGIGTTTPVYPLTFNNDHWMKIALRDDPNGNADYGIGLNQNQMRFNLGGEGGRFSFLDSIYGAEVFNIGAGATPGVTINTGGGFDYPQLSINQTANDWSRIRMKSNGPAWDIALSAGPTPVMNFYNGNANVLSLEHAGNATLTGNLTFSTSSGLRPMLNLWNSEYTIGVQHLTTYFRSGGGYSWYRGGAHNDNQHNAGGGEELMRLNTGGLTVRGTFVSTSDRNMKENIREVNPREVLEKVVTMPVSRWNYLDDPDSDHIGPMAQDFHAAFSAGADDKHIATVDADGVALAAIKGLNEKIEEKDREIESLREKNDAMDARLEALERALKNIDKDSPR